MVARAFAGNDNGWQPTIEEVAGFLNTQQLGRVGTLGLEGQPQIANVAFFGERPSRTYNRHERKLAQSDKYSTRYPGCF